MAVGGGQRLRITAYDDSGDAVGFRVRAVRVRDGRLGCCAPAELVRLVERDPRVAIEGVGPGTAAVARSGRSHAEVHGLLRRLRTTRGPVVLVEPDGAGRGRGA